MNKKLLSKLSVLGIGASIIAPIAAVVSCDDSTSQNKDGVGFVVTPDGKIGDGFFSPMWKAVEAAATENSVGAKYQEVTQKEDSATIDAVDTLVEAGSKVVFQPGFMNSATILDNAQKHKDTKFIGVSYTKYVASAKAFTEKDSAKINTNMTTFDATSNLGLIHFKTQEQGFRAGYITAATYVEKNPNEAEIKYSVVSSKAYQDTTALLDGFIAGVNALAQEKSKTTKLIEPTASGFFTNVTVEDGGNFSSTNTAALNKIKTEGAKFVFIGDPNSIKEFAGKGLLVASDGGDFGKDYSDVVIATDKDWNKVFTTATKAALKEENTFKTEYHDKMHLSTFDNGELIISPTKNFTAALEGASKTALTTWESSLTADANNIYTKVGTDGKETEAGTSKGLGWYSDLR